jgi:shikimate kinase
MVKTVVLIGPMGVGKTTIGKKLAKSLGLPFIDTDKEIVRDHGSISKIFEKQGEKAFRSLESDYLVKALVEGGVIATGGGIITQDSNRKLLSDHLVIYLSTNGLHIASRLLGGKRPLLKNGVSDWKRIYEERKPLYEEVAKFEVSTSSKPLSQIVGEVAEIVRKNG